MNVLVYGNGAREHTIVHSILKSPLLSKLYLANPNDGFRHLGIEINEFDNFSTLANMALEKKIDLLIVGPENPLANGIANEIKKVGISVIGPDKYWAQLESSKHFAKLFMDKYNIAFANYIVVEDENDIEKKISEFIDLYKTDKFVLKADGLAFGKGVFIVEGKSRAIETLKLMFQKKRYKKVLIEEYLEGFELSLISMYDGKNLMPFIEVKDYKKLLDNDLGPNTGSMGAYCPVNLNICDKNNIIDYIKKLHFALINEKADFIGFIYSGLILTKDGIKVLEYNVRLGDPEAQVLLLNLKTDLLEVFSYAINKKLDQLTLKWSNNSTICVVIASKGYPFEFKTGFEIVNVFELEKKYNVKIFFSGVKKIEGKLYSNGGRVLSICGENKKDIYKCALELKLENKIYRSDISL